MAQSDLSQQHPQPYLCFSIGQTELGIPVSQIWMIVQGTTIEEMAAGPGCLIGKMPFYKGDIPVVDPLALLPFLAATTLHEGSNILMMHQEKTDFFGFPVNRILDIRSIGSDQFLAEDQASGLHLPLGVIGRVWLNKRTIHIIDARQLLSRETMRQCHKALNK
ncbi:MAG TPA: chemotaxis protein CheW [Bacteroidales bacterium]|nr:chemotaxis protein CheW [Bacteroidales bacterium]